MTAHKFGDERLPDYVWRRLRVTESGCWEWTGPLNHAGYARTKVRFDGESRMWRLHRLTYTAFVGPISAGMTVDHLCCVRHCCNPGHLEQVTQRANTLRGATVNAANLRKTHCPRGHRYTVENTYVCPKGRRNCRTCTADSKRRYERRRRLVPVLAQRGGSAPPAGPVGDDEPPF